MVQPATALTLAPFQSRYSANIAGDFSVTGNTVLSCSTQSGDVGASSCIQARRREGVALNNDDHFMRNVEVPIPGVDATGVFNASSHVIEIPAESQISYAELIWSGSLLREAGDVAASDPTRKNEVLFDTQGHDCATSISHCRVTAPLANVEQELLGTYLGQYRASAVVTTRVRSAQWSEYKGKLHTTVTVGNVQTTQGADKAAGWSLIVVYEQPGHQMRHVQILGGLGVVAKRSGVVVDLTDFLTPQTSDVQSNVGVIGFDGDLGSRPDSVSLRSDGNQVNVSDGQNSADNVANSSILESSTNAYLDDSGVGKSSNTFGVDADRINLVDALEQSSTSAELVLSTQNETWYPVALAYSTELASAGISLTKVVSRVTGANVNSVDTGDLLTYTIKATNAGTGPATNVVVTDVLPQDLTLVSSTGTNCSSIPAQQVCKSLGRINAGASATFTITGQVNGHSLPTTGEFSNWAEVTFTSHLGQNSAISNTVVTNYGPLMADVAIALKFTDRQITYGSYSGLQLTVMNAGPAADPDPTINLYLVRSRANTYVLPTGCAWISTTRIKCTGEVFGISSSKPLKPGQVVTRIIRLHPIRTTPELIVKGFIQTGVAAGDSNMNNNTAYSSLSVQRQATIEQTTPAVQPTRPRCFTSVRTGC